MYVNDAKRPNIKRSNIQSRKSNQNRQDDASQPLEPHSCSENPYNQQQHGTVEAQKPELKEASSMRALEIQKLNRKIDLIIRQLTALCQRYDVVLDNVQSGV